MSEKMLDMLFRLCCDIVVYKNSDLRYVTSNLNMKFSNTIKNNDIAGKTVYDVLPLDVANIVHANDIKVINTLKPVKYRLEFDKNSVFEIISSPVMADDTLTGIISIGRDMTFETKIKEQRESFVATLTHDLKTPTLAQIRMIELLLDDAFGKTSLMQKEMLNQILKSCKYMQQMISYVLSTYKFENGKANLVKEDFNLAGLIEECCLELNSLNVDKNLKFITKFNIKNPIAEGDRAQLKRVIINMISNAVSYAFNNTEIEIVLEENDNDIIFYTVNKSPYMSKDVLNHIFDKYVSGSACTKFNKTGTGLGLYLSEQIITAHNGKIFAESFDDNRNKIGFSVPKTQKEAAAVF